MKKSSKHKDDSFDPKNFKQEAELTNKSVELFLLNKLNDKINKRKDVEAMVHTIKEFLNCFIILGYNFEGEPVNIISANNQQEADSLATLVNKVFITNNQKDIS
jgi:hypothetical protein